MLRGLKKFSQWNVPWYSTVEAQLTFQSAPEISVNETV